MNYEEIIEESSNQFLYGNIIIKGTTISVGTIIRELSQANSINDIITKRPEISSSDILACLEYAAELIDATEYKKAKTAINTNIAKRKALADRIRGLKGKFR